MNAVGIDVSKGKSTVAILRPTGEAVRQQLKTANRQYQLYVKMKTRLKNNLIALLDQT